jgi:hypothetical protein
MVETLTLADFAQQLQTRFQVTGEEDQELVLTSATDLSNDRLEQFSLIFTGKASPWLPQRLYKLTHARMGEIELFLVPIGAGAVGMQYQAAFSRFIEA